MVTKAHEATVFLTVRNPIEGLFSLYVQNFHILKGSYPDFDCFVNSSNNVNLYHYDQLLGYLEQLFGSENVKLLCYKKLLQDKKAFFRELFAIFGADCPEGDVVFGEANTKRKDESGIYTGDTSLSDLILRLGSSPIGKLVIQWPWVKAVGTSVINVTRRIRLKGSSRLIPKLTDEEVSDLKETFQRSNDVFFEKTGIDYR